jgi:metallo-beta-lactamase family protein
MRITFYGAAQTVTGSKHMLEVNGKRILLDCGMFQGRRQEAFNQNRKFPFAASLVDTVVLSHAHIDHSGALPNLVKSGFMGDIVCTSATRDLCATMLPDSGYIQERDAEYINRTRRQRDQKPVAPVYTHRDALESLQYFTTRPYHRPYLLAPDVELTFFDAGHMLGSAIVQLQILDHDDGQHKRLIFTGDLGREGIPIIRDPETCDRADILIMESTYGNRTHDAYFDSAQTLARIVNETVERGGQIVMPSFAVGRTQQLVFSLHQLADSGEIPRLPIYVDSPLAVDATAVFELHPECYDDVTLDFMRDHDPFGFDEVTYIRKVEDSKRLNGMDDPAVIISASGMAEFGRVLHHLAHRIEDDRHTVLITGWQAPHTLGRRLVERAETVRILGDDYTRRARVEVINGFSGHADKNEIAAWLSHLNFPPDHTFLVHGEPESAYALKQDLEAGFGMQVAIPAQGETFYV